MKPEYLLNECPFCETPSWTNALGMVIAFYIVYLDQSGSGPTTEVVACSACDGQLYNGPWRKP